VATAGNAARKAELRIQARVIGSADRRESALVVLRNLCALPEFARARTIALYAAIGDEVPVDAALPEIHARRGRALYPVRLRSGLELALVRSEDDLRAGLGGIREPGPESPRVAVEEVDAIVVPGLLFDHAGRRLGRGGGHYDRLLRHARADAALIGICYADRVIEPLPQDPWDIAMNFIVTERSALRVADGRAV
jgi:5-formyltetrahydrofolate cyclo-ligase